MHYFSDDRNNVYAFDAKEDAPSHLVLVKESWALRMAALKPSTQLATEESLCLMVDQAADTSRSILVGDPLRAVEYGKASTEAQAFKDAGYPADNIPRAVLAWAINGRTAQQATDNILSEASALTDVLFTNRETRLAAKEQIRTLIATGKTDQATKVATGAVALFQTMSQRIDVTGFVITEGVKE